MYGWRWDPVVGDPLDSSPHSATSVVRIVVQCTQQTADRIKVVVVPHDGCASFWRQDQARFVAVLLQVINKLGLLKT